MEESLWMKLYQDDIEYKKLESDEVTDVVIIGGGMTGLSAAYHLLSKNYRVILVEANQIASSASGRNTGKLTAQHGLIYDYLINKKGMDQAKYYYQCQKESIESIEKIINRYSIHCHFKRTSTTIQSSDINKIDKEYKAYQQLDIPCSISKNQKHATLTMHHQATLNPYAFLRQFAKILVNQGLKIYENSVYFHYKKEINHYCVEINDHIINTRCIIFATQFPIVDKKHFYYTRMIPIQKTIYTSECHDEYKPFVLLDEPGYSLNLHQNYLLLVQLLAKGRDMFDDQKITSITQHFFDRYDFNHQWTSSDYMSVDQLPYIGLLDKDEENVYFASGYSQWGNTLGFMAGRLLSEYIDKKEVVELFSPQRISDRFTLDFMKANLKTVSLLLKSHFQEVGHELPCVGEGKIMNIQGKKLGVYLDEDMVYHVVDVTCPHLGCICSFHQKDKTWDCPCHGSRFNYKGEIIKGPSRYQLAYIKIEKTHD